MSQTAWSAITNFAFYLIYLFLFLIYSTSAKRTIWTKDIDNLQQQVADLTGWGANNILYNCQGDVVEYYGNVLGTFGSNTIVQKTYSGLPPHWSLSVKYDWIKSQSWDLEQMVIKLDSNVLLTDVYTTNADSNIVICKILPENTANKDDLWPSYNNLTHTSASATLWLQSSLNEALTSEGWFLFDIKIYLDTCHDTCLTCTGPASNQCGTCAVGFSQVATTCSCNTGYALNQICYASCPAGYLEDALNKICYPDPFINCMTKNQTTQLCLACNKGYLNLYGECVSFCPGWTALMSDHCVDIATISNTNPFYLLKAFMQNDFVNEDIAETGLTVSLFTAGQRMYSDCGPYRIFGGFGVFNRKQEDYYITKVFNFLPPHFSVRIKFMAFFIDAWTNTDFLKVTVDGTEVLKVTKDVIQPLTYMCGWNQQGMTYMDQIQQIDINVTHTSSTLVLNIMFDFNVRKYDKSGGMRDLLVYIEKCLYDNCGGCNDGTGCSSCATGTLSNKQCQITCPQGQYFIVDKCLPCPQFCSQCTSPTNCQACKGSNRLTPLCVCPTIGYFEDKVSDTCPSCAYQCLTCSGTNTQCSQCKNDRVLAPLCLCQTGLIDLQNPNCDTCIHYCSSCSGTTNNVCTTCKGNNRYLAPTCKCLDGYYEDMSSLHCPKCNLQCNTCQTNSGNCLTCKGDRQVAPTCSCPTGTLDEGKYMCTKCKFPCASCSSTPANCGTCSSVTRQNPPLCDCKTSFYEEYLQECGNCNYKCSSCITSSTNCQTCSGGGTRGSTPTCDCIAGYYEDLVSQACPACSYTYCQQCITLPTNCLVCTAPRINLPFCQCPIKYYDNGGTCTSCLQQCATCESGVQCLSCKGDRINPPTCDCPPGLFDDTLQQCSQCLQKCKLCSNILGCTACKGDRAGIPNCLCPAGLYDDGVSDYCQKCPDTCLACDISSCQSCKANRDPALHCNCPAGGVEYNHTFYCGTCDTIVGSAKMSEDYQKISIKMNAQVELKSNLIVLPAPQNLCSLLFQGALNPLLLSLGTNPFCQISIDQKSVEIQLGQNPTIMPGDPINIAPNVLIVKSCPLQQIGTFILGNLQPSDLLFPPGADVVQPQPNLITTCDDIVLTIKNIVYNGNRVLQGYVWLLISVVPSNPATEAVLTGILSAANIAQQNTITIPKLTLNEFSSYQIRLRYNNFMQITGSNVFILQTQSWEGPLIQLVQKSTWMEYAVSETVVVEAGLKHWKCDSGLMQYIYDPMKIEWTQIDGPNSLGIDSTLNTQNGDNYTFIQINPYSGRINQSYTIQIKISLLSKPTLYQTDQIVIKYKQRDLQVAIAGDDRAVSYLQNISFEGIVDDPDTSVLNDSDITLSWECHIYQNKRPCKLINGSILVLNQSSLTQLIPGEIIMPFYTYAFTFTGFKDVRKASSRVLIDVNHDVFGSLAADIPSSGSGSGSSGSSGGSGSSGSPVKKINFNDFVEINVNLTGFSNLENLVFTANIYYRYEQVGDSLRFYFKNFRFRVWDLVSNLSALMDSSITREISLHIFVFEVNSSVLYSNKETYEINFPPRDGDLLVSPMIGTGIQTDFIIKAEAYVDEDLPLLYRFSIYLQNSDYDGNVESDKALVLQDYSLIDTINIKLPGGKNVTEGSIIVVLCNIKDNIGGIRNETQKVRVKQIKRVVFNVEDQVTIIRQYLGFDVGTPTTNIGKLLVAVSEADNLEYNAGNEEEKERIFALKRLLHSHIASLTPSSELVRNQIVKMINILNSKDNIWSNQYTTANLTHMTEQNMQIINDSYSNAYFQLQKILAEKQYLSDTSKAQEKVMYQNQIEQLGMLIDRVYTFSRSSDLEQEQFQSLSLGLLQNISLALIQSKLPNEPEVVIKGNNILVKSVKITQKLLEQVFLETNDKQFSQLDFNSVSGGGSRRNLAVTQQQDIYDFSVIQINRNLFSNTDYKFYYSYKAMNVPVYYFQLYKEVSGGGGLVVNLTNNYSGLQLANISQTPLTFTFTVDYQVFQENSQKIHCAFRRKPGEYWTDNHCIQQQRTNIETMTVEIQCSCSELGDLTLAIFKNITETTVSPPVEPQLPYKWYANVVIMIIVTSTIIWLFLILWIEIIDKKERETLLEEAKKYSKCSLKQVETIFNNNNQINNNDIEQEKRNEKPLKLFLIMPVACDGTAEKEGVVVTEKPQMPTENNNEGAVTEGNKAAVREKPNLTVEVDSRWQKKLEEEQQKAAGDDQVIVENPSPPQKQGLKKKMTFVPQSKKDESITVSPTKSVQLKKTLTFVKRSETIGKGKKPNAPESAANLDNMPQLVQYEQQSPSPSLFQQIQQVDIQGFDMESPQKLPQNMQPPLIKFDQPNDDDNNNNNELSPTTLKSNRKLNFDGINNSDMINEAGQNTNNPQSGDTAMQQSGQMLQQYPSELPPSNIIAATQENAEQTSPQKSQRFKSILKSPGQKFEFDQAGGEEAGTNRKSTLFFTQSAMMARKNSSSDSNSQSAESQSVGNQPPADQQQINKVVIRRSKTQLYDRKLQIIDQIKLLHQYFSIYFYSNHEYPRAARITLLYFKAILYLEIVGGLNMMFGILTVSIVGQILGQVCSSFLIVTIKQFITSQLLLQMAGYGIFIVIFGQAMYCNIRILDNLSQSLTDKWGIEFFIVYFFDMLVIETGLAVIQYRLKLKLWI